MDAHDLETLGWTAEFAAAFRPHADAGLVAARVGAQHRGVYVLYGEHGELRAESAGRLRRGAGPADLPAVGDWVAASVLADGRAMVHAVLPRRTKLSRKATGLATEEQVVAANADLVFLVCGLVPDPSPRRLERHLAAVWESGAEPVVVLTKTDLCEDARAWATDVEAIASGAPVHAISNVTGEGVEELRRLLGSRTAALLGLSGAGKSSLVNRLAGEEVLAVQELRADGRGRHTTTHRELVLLPGGGLLLDTPGLRELALWDAGAGLEAVFADVEELAAACRFHDCGHGSEPGCAVREAVGAGLLPAERLAGYEKLQRERAHLGRRLDQRAAAEERRKWRALSRAYRQRDGLRP